MARKVKRKERDAVVAYTASWADEQKLALTAAEVELVRAAFHTELVALFRIERKEVVKDQKLIDIYAEILPYIADGGG